MRSNIESDPKFAYASPTLPICRCKLLYIKKKEIDLKWMIQEVAGMGRTTPEGYMSTHARQKPSGKVLLKTSFN